MKMFSNLTAVFLISAALAAQSTANVPRTDAAQRAVWDLTVIFPDPAAAERERLAVIAALPSLAAFKGHLGLSELHTYDFAVPLAEDSSYYSIA